MSAISTSRAASSASSPAALVADLGVTEADLACPAGADSPGQARWPSTDSRPSPSATVANGKCDALRDRLRLDELALPSRPITDVDDEGRAGAEVDALRPREETDAKEDFRPRETGCATRGEPPFGRERVGER